MAYNQEERVQQINPTPVETPAAQGNYQGNQPPRPSNHMAWAIVVTILGCCHCLPLILGVVSIVYASKVNRLYDGGQIAEAYAASRNAKTWAVVATALLAIGYVASLIVSQSEAYQAQVQRMLETYGY